MEARFEDLTRQMADPQIINDNDTYRKVSKQQSELGEVVSSYREWKKLHASTCVRGSGSTTVPPHSRKQPSCGTISAARFHANNTT